MKTQAPLYAEYAYNYLDGESQGFFSIHRTDEGYDVRLDGEYVGYIYVGDLQYPHERRRPWVAETVKGFLIGRAREIYQAGKLVVRAADLERRHSNDA